METCLQIGANLGRSECVWSVVGTVSQSDSEAAATLCGELTGFHREECFFVVAERSGEARWCADAGDYAPPCRNHLAFEVIERLDGADGLPGRFENEIINELTPFELPDSDWPDLYLRALAPRLDLSSSLCTSALHPEPCLVAVQTHYRAVLDELIENRKLRCEGALPGRVQAFDSAEFGPLVERAREQGRCVHIDVVGGGQ